MKLKLIRTMYPKMIEWKIHLYLNRKRKVQVAILYMQFITNFQCQCFYCQEQNMRIQSTIRSRIQVPVGTSLFGLKGHHLTLLFWQLGPKYQCHSLVSTFLYGLKCQSSQKPQFVFKLLTLLHPSLILVNSLGTQLQSIQVG